MALYFSSSGDNQGIVEQVRSLMRVDSNQWPTAKIVASVNNHLDHVTGYAIGADKRFQWDNTNHTKSPNGTTDLIANQTTYSFLTDEQGNQIVTLTRLDAKDSSGNWRQLDLIDQTDITGFGLDSSFATAGVPSMYDKVADNIVKLLPASSVNVTAGLKFYFQRTSPYFTALSTTTTTGFSGLLDRGFVIAAALDGAITLGLANLNILQAEMNKEEQKMIGYFGRDRNNDQPNSLSVKRISFR